jgi:hypothetical protein
MGIEVSHRKAKLTTLEEYCHFSNEGDFIEAVEWSNGEGVDININSTRHQQFSLTHGEFQALQALMAYQEKS